MLVYKKFNLGKIYSGLLIKTLGDWGLGIGDWGLGQSPIPNPQSPIPISKKILILL